MGIPTVTADRLILRGFEEADVKDLHAILQTPNIRQYFLDPNPPPMEWVRALIARKLVHWQEKGCGWWAVVPKAGGPLIGWAGLAVYPETGETEVGYLLAKPYWGQGLATEAARSSMEWGFANLDLGRMIGIAHPDNLPSQRVLLRLGMEDEGIFTYYGVTVQRYATTRERFSQTHPS